MNNEHNPIAQLITTIQQKWIKDVTPYPSYKLIRWLINAEIPVFAERTTHLRVSIALNFAYNRC